MTISNRLKAIRNAAKMRARGYRNSGNRTPTGLIIWTKTVRGNTKRKTANNSPVNNRNTTNNIPPMDPEMYTNSNYKPGKLSNAARFNQLRMSNRTGGIAGMN